MRTNSRLSARAIDSPTEVLPVPGGPIRVRIAPERLSSAMPRSCRSLRTARYSTIRSLTSSRPAWSLSRTSRTFTGSRRSSERFPHGTASSQSRYVRIIEDSPLWSPDLALGLLANLLGEVRFGDLLTVVVRDRGLVLAQLLADRLELTAQDVLAL